MKWWKRREWKSWKATIHLFSNAE